MRFLYGLKNFKAFKDLHDLELKPITVLCGPNNSGKSSILKSLLMLRTSLAFLQGGIGGNKRHYKPLVYNLPLHYLLGSWDKIIFNHNINNKLEFNFALDLKDEYSNKKEEINKAFPDIKSALDKINSDNFNLNLTVKIGYLSSGKQYQEFITNVDYEDLVGNYFKIDYQKESELYKIDSNLKNEQLKMQMANYIKSNIGSIISMKLNLNINGEKFKSVIEKYTEVLDETVSKIIKIIFEDFVSINFKGIFPLNVFLSNDSRSKIVNIISKALETIDIKNLSLKEEEKSRIVPMDITNFIIPEPYNYLMQYISSFLMDLKYIGPLRVEPEYEYGTISDLHSMGVGPRGQDTAVIMFENKDMVVSDGRMEIKNGVFSGIEKRDEKLGIILNGWLSFLGLPHVSSNKITQSNYQILIPRKSFEEGMPDVGFGVSQILPILVESLLCKENETIILEQPEIHLHPRLQSKLADFIICMASTGRRFIIETHSEHIINRLCLRIAQDKTDEISQLVNVRFIEPDMDGEGAYARQVIINEFGEIENWPVGFFDEDDSGAIMAAGFSKRKEREKE